jgi:predicted MPP superfamily phosphohydrolase
MASPWRTASGVVAGAAVVGGAALGYALWEAQAYTVRRFTVPVLPDEARPFTILHLSDLHLTPSQERKIAWLRTLGDLDPDLVVSTGDHLAHRDAVPVLLDALDPLLERPGLFVFGSNDYYAPAFKNPLNYVRPGPARIQHGGLLPWEDLHDGLAASGWRDLNNGHCTVTINGTDIDVTGVDDPHLRRDRYDEVAGGDSADAGLRLGITHAPYLRVLDAMVQDHRDLILAGHTHGGQVCLPGYGTLVTNCDLDRRRARGLTEHPDRAIPTDEGAAWLHVSAGVGTNPYTPIRVACRPEAVLLRLVPRGSAPS